MKALEVWYEISESVKSYDRVIVEDDEDVATAVHGKRGFCPETTVTVIDTKDIRLDSLVVGHLTAKELIILVKEAMKQ